MHELAFKEETATDVVFHCSHCTGVIVFNKPGIGKPFPVMDKATGNWLPPDGFALYMNPCVDLVSDLRKAEFEVVSIKEKIAAAELSNGLALAESADGK